MRESDVQIKITLAGSELSKPALGDIALFIYDFDSLYEVSRISVDPKYEDYKFSRFTLYRNGRPIDPEDRMRVEMLRLESPLEMSATIVAYSAAVSSVLATLWLLIQILEKVTNFKLNREKLSLEVLKLKRDLGMTDVETKHELRDDPIATLNSRDALPYVQTLTKRLAKSEVVVEEMRIEAIDVSDHKQLSDS